MELTKIKGISDARKTEFNKFGIYDTADLIGFFPRAYLDLREQRKLISTYHNDLVLTAGRVVSIPINRNYRNRGALVKVVCEQEGLIFSVVWFNQPYVLTKLKAGEEYLFYGRVQHRFGEISLVNPTFELCDKIYRLKGIVPQYQLKGKLPQKLVRDAARLAVDIEKPKSIIPRELLTKFALMDLYSAYKTVHNPDSFQSLMQASDRIAVEEYFKLISAFKYIKGGSEQVRINKYNCTAKDIVEFIVSRFPFEFTEGQKKAVNEIFSDMTSGKVMNRLVQGDVGSGKTAVSVVATFIAIMSGYQVVFLAPTEVLARQNHQVLSNVLSDYNVGLLTGGMKQKEKKDVKEKLKNGEINVLVGTHAVLEDNVEFKSLALCVCDEQQRFGVAQRSALTSKGVTPDVLVMSATPIPRTLSLIFYGDLDITTIPDKPKMRVEIQTNIVPTSKYNDMLGFIRKEIEQGRQAYFVCPKIDGDDEGALSSATELYEEIKGKMQGINVGLLHGRMKDAEKTQIMQMFKENQIQLLVSTTVIEVGVDVPNASVMVIYNAERFGLSQLHQLRGRVGRSNIKSYCFLTTSKTDGTALERLKIIKENTDGFKISEQDYKIRGGGDFMGDRQSGKFMSDLGNLSYDTSAIFLAKKISDEAFISGQMNDVIRLEAIKKYDKLKNITLN